MPQIPAYSLTTANFVDAVTTHEESHAILDFTAGKDMGLGMFGLDGSSVLSAGVRFAQFASQSSVDMHARPDLQFHQIGPFPQYGITEVKYHPFFHTYRAAESASRNFRGVGPSIAWTGSASMLGDRHDGEIFFDWGANAALLFGRQKTRVQHQATGYYHGWQNVVYATQVYQHATPVPARSRSVTIPNLGGFAGASYRFNNAKLSLGYRADFFFGAIDGGVDARKSETLGFFGPFANVSIGLGG